MLKPYKSITHNNQTGRWLTTFKAEWHPTRDHIFLGDGGENLASVCSIVKCHPTQDIVVGGNS